MVGHRAAVAAAAPPAFSPRRAAPLLAIAALAALAALLPRASAYSSNPFQGQGVAPEGNVK